MNRIYTGLKLKTQTKNVLIILLTNAMQHTAEEY